MAVPKVTSILLVILTTLTLLNFLLKYYTYFVLIVASSKSPTTVSTEPAPEQTTIPHPHELFVPLLTFIPSKSTVLAYPWVILTCSFVEETFIGLFVSIIGFFYLGKYLENAWSSPLEFLKFVMFNIIVTNVSLYLYYTVKSWLVTSEDVPVVLSSMGIIMGFIVAIKQRIPNHFFILFKGNLRIKVKYLPFIIIVLSLVLTMLNSEYYITYLMSSYGFIVSWFYLRFIKTSLNEGQSYLIPFTSAVPPEKQKEDYDESKPETQFALHTFFPYPLSSIVQLVSSIVYSLAVKYHIISHHPISSNLGEEQFNSKLFTVSSLKGVKDVGILNISKVFQWFNSGDNNRGINNSMDKRRKLALKEIDH
ncbi:hypothetical protein JA1_002756 [Spathaspora sp. JA1]|nr:hypothetical protein JA1_002756 [Spathaspora sp. JA1]